MIPVDATPPMPSHLNLAPLTQAAADAAVPTVFDIVFPVTILVLIGVAIPAGMIIANKILSGWALGKRGSPGQDTQVESGLAANIGTSKERFSVKFYLIAMLFLAFDLEVAFLYPWAVHFPTVEGWSMIALLIPFLVMLEVGYLYLFRKGALDWEE